LKVLDLIKLLQDIDQYENAPLDSKEVCDLLEAVRWSPSAANIQPWEVYVIEDKSLKKELDGCVLDPLLREKMQDNRISKAPVVIVIAMDKKRARARFGQSGEEFYALQDLAVAANNLRLAAAERGIGSTWIREVNLEKVAKVLGLSKLIRPVALLTMGYTANRDSTRPAPLEIKEWVHVHKGGD